MEKSIFFFQIQTFDFSYSTVWFTSKLVIVSISKLNILNNLNSHKKTHVHIIMFLEKYKFNKQSVGYTSGQR